MKINKKDLMKTKGNGLQTPVFPLDTLSTKEDIDKYISETIASKIAIDKERKMRKLEQSELEILNKMTEQHKAKYRNR